MLKHLLALSVATACALAPTLSRADAAVAHASKDSFQLIHVSDLATMLSSSTAPTVYDANNDQTRKDSGIIPGAKLLSSSSKYDLSVLPGDKATPVVFYCANTKCMASHAAAKRASKAGYTNVSVLADGIQGWVKAGQKVDKAVN